MKGFDTLRIKSAIKDRSHDDLSCSHITTMNFGEILPLYVSEMVQGDNFKVSANYFSRMLPMPVPTYGRFSFRTLTVFVPYYQVDEDFDAWFAGKSSYEGETPASRFITYDDYVSFFTGPQTGEQSDYVEIISVGEGEVDNSDGYVRDLETGAIVRTYDWSYINASGTTVRIKFLPPMKVLVKILNCLGYALPSNVDLRTTSVWYSKFHEKTISMMPLLAFCKGYNDFMSQSQRFNTSNLSRYLIRIKRNTTIKSGDVVWYSSSTNCLSAYMLYLLLRQVVLCYENDYFTSAWQTAHNPLSGSDNVTSVRVPNEGTVDYSSTTGATYNELPSSLSGFSQTASMILRAFSDFIRRNNYSGSRDVQALYSRFGIKTDDYKSKYAHFVDFNKQSVSVGDVTATAQSDSVPLGDYAGKGIMSGSKGCSYKASDYGLFMILGWYTVTPFNAYGFSRHCLRIDPFDYYQPEFDAVGPQAISAGEVQVDPFCPKSTDTAMFDDTVFGFTERYNEYRFGRDMITGEFRDYHLGSPMNAWHTGRLLTSMRRAGTMVAQSASMNTQPQTDSEFNRMFSITDSSEDKFYLVCQFKVDAIRPMKNLNQTPHLGDGNTVVARNGNEVS